MLDWLAAFPNARFWTDGLEPGTTAVGAVGGTAVAVAVGAWVGVTTTVGMGVAAVGIGVAAVGMGGAIVAAGVTAVGRGVTAGLAPVLTHCTASK